MYLAPKLSLPSISHLMGTDQFGRDVMSRIMKGIQVSFGIGVVVVAAGGLVGTLLGACSGYFGGYLTVWLDEREQVWADYDNLVYYYGSDIFSGVHLTIQSNNRDECLLNR